MFFAVKFYALWCICGIAVGVLAVACAKHKKYTDAEFIDALPKWVLALMVVAMCPCIIIVYAWKLIKGD